MNVARLIVVAILALGLASPAFAQTPAAGMFGATRPDSVDRDKLNVVVSVAEGLDSEVPLEFVSLAPRNLQSGGLSSVLAATADYSRTRPRVELFGTASTYFRYANRLDRFDPGTQNAQLGVGLRLPKRGKLELSQSASYSPSYLYLLLPTAAPPTAGEPMPGNPEFQIDQTESYSHQSRMRLSFGSALGTRLTTTATVGRTDFRNPIAERWNLETYSSDTRVSRAISRTSTFSVGYEYSAGRFGDLGLSKEHRATMGVTYSPVLSVSRRATLRLDVSSSLFDIPPSALNGLIASAVARRVYPLQGEAGVDYPFRLKWRAAASYRRAVEYVPGTTEPMFTNGGRMRLIGVIGRRVDVSAQAGSAMAESVISRDDRSFRTYTGEARFRYAFTRAFALYTEYSYYYYDLRGRAHIASGLPGVYEQHGLRLGFMLFAQPVSR